MSLKGKIARVFALLLVIVGFYAFFTYFNALEFKADPALTDCWGTVLVDNQTGERVAGVEDIDFDPRTSTLFFSAYDRRAVALEMEQGRILTQGGIYTLNASKIHKSAHLQVTDISRSFKAAGNEFRPHGIYLGMAGSALLAINRLNAKKGSDRDFEPVFDLFFLHEGKWGMVESFRPAPVCNPYDVVFRGDGKTVSFIYTDVSRFCDGATSTRGSLNGYDNGSLVPVLNDLDFPNGLMLTHRFLVVSETLEDTIRFVKLEGKGSRVVDLPIAPDNLTVDQEDNIYVAGFSNLLDYYLYMKQWLWVKKSPSAVIRIEPGKKDRQTLMFKDKGGMISGVTVAQRAGDYLVMGAAWDDNIAICRGMNGLKK